MYTRMEVLTLSYASHLNDEHYAGIEGEDSIRVCVCVCVCVLSRTSWVVGLLVMGMCGFQKRDPCRTDVH